MNSPDLHPPTRPHAWAQALLCCGALLLGATPAQAGWLDTLFGSGSAQTEAAKPGAGQRLWRIHDFSSVALAARETGSVPNGQPITLTMEGLRQQLAQVQSVGPGGAQPLFATDELAELVGPLVQAFGRAGPGDDVLLLSSSRRDTGVLSQPTAITARLFVQDNQLHLIVHDARYEFYDAYRGTNVAPRFTFGARSGAGAAVITSADVPNRRADWLAIALNRAAGPAVVQPAAAMTAPLLAPALAPALAPLAAPMPAAATPPARRPLDAAGAEDIERRLETLKRLREKNLISEDEYQQKRKEILQLL